jgi:nucleoside phosphorylase/CheY-like chemotaxis protein
MRFLIVDDDHQKIALVRSFLVERGVSEGDVLTADHAAGARVLLAREAVNVLLIDVLLPARSGAEPRGENSIELLRQIVEDGTSPAPRHIFGMTASGAALVAFEEEFSSLVTQILHISPGHDQWRESLNAFLTLLKRIDDARDNNDFDVCVLNALRTPELEAVHTTWPVRLEAERFLSRNILYRSGVMSLDGTERRVVCAHLSQMGPVASAHASTALLQEFRPRVLMMTGICGGFSDHVDIGDVVVAEKSWDWQAGKWSDEGTLVTAPDQRDGSAELLAEAQAVGEMLKEMHKGYRKACPTTPPKLVIAPMVTGSSVVASRDIQKVFRNQHRKMAAIDMECYGMYYAALNHAGAPVRAVCVKSVSDLADRAKSDDHQSYCSYISAVVALEILRRHFHR